MFFFFQAEDGIRDVAVTGVQTCALPISAHRRDGAGVPSRLAELGDRGADDPVCTPHRGRCPLGRSEERRVGKECRSRWSLYHEKKKLVCELTRSGLLAYNEKIGLMLAQL